MAINVTGLITINGKQIIEVDNSPITEGQAAPTGSLALYEDGGGVGHLYLKFGSGATDWSENDMNPNDWGLAGNNLTGGTPGTPDQLFGSLNDYDVKFLRNNSEVMRLAAGNLLVGLSVSLGGKLQVKGAVLGNELIKQITNHGAIGVSDVINVTRQYKVLTTTAASGVLSSLLIPAETNVLVNYKIGCNQYAGSAGAVGDGAAYERTYRAKRLVAGNAVLSKVQTDFTDEDVKDFDVGFIVNTNNIDLSVTGALNRSLAWSALAEIMIFKD